MNESNKNLENLSKDATVFIKTNSGISLRTAVFSPKYSSPKKRAVCILLHGRTEYIEKYEEVIGELLERGFVVATFDWRGQGLSTRSHTDPLTQHVRDFKEYDEDFDAFFTQIVEPLEGPKIVLAHSMGGNITLRAINRHPNQFQKAVLSAPMILLHRTWLIEMASSFMGVVGLSSRGIVNHKTVCPLNVSFENNLLTTDKVRYERIQNQLVTNPKLRVGAPTWAWLSAALSSMRLVKNKEFTAKLKIPLLICGAGKDEICKTESTREFAAPLENAQYVEFPFAKHEILMETDEVRGRFWEKFDEFCDS